MKLYARCGNPRRARNAQLARDAAVKKTKRAADFRAISNPSRRLRIGAVLAYAA